MIVIVTGGIGSGKTLSVVKDIVDRNQLVFTNFNLYKHDKNIRLKYEHLFNIETETSERGKKTQTMTLNFDYWNETVKKHDGFDIALDEFHNVMNSRRSMSKRNVLLSDWLSQIRKILGQSERNHLYLITQKLRRIDVNSRDLAHLCISCQKVETDIKIPTIVCQDGKFVKKDLNMVMIYKNYFKDSDSLSMYESYGVKSGMIGTTCFIGNPYFKYFNSYDLIDFGSEEYL